MAINQRSLLRIAFSILAAVAIASLFQNCGRMSSDSALVTGEVIPYGQSVPELYFYPYESKPEVYGQIQFVRNTATAGFSDVTAVAVMGHADGKVGTFDYVLTMINENGDAICKSETGRLVGGGTSIVVPCVTLIASKHVTLTLKVTVVPTSGTVVGKTYTFTREY